MPLVTVRCCTWNVGDQGPPPDDLSTLLGVDEKTLPDVIGIALQEVINADDWRDTLVEHLSSKGYVLLKARNCWAIWMLAFVRRNLLVAITNVESEATASGYAGLMGNKGGVSVRFEVCGINLIFLSCHFTAHMKNTKERMNDYLDILEQQSFRDDDVNVVLDHDYVFWLGDLNFRLEGITKAEVEAKIAQGDLTSLHKLDQLNRLKRSHKIFQDFQEGKLDFPPTFKFDPGTDIYDTSKKQRIPAWTDRILYMAHRDFALDHHLNVFKDPRRRSPSPSRRIPVRGPPSEVEKMFPTGGRTHGPTQHPELFLLRYTSLPQYKSSDHRPVAGDFQLAIPARWFSLPVQFYKPRRDNYSANEDLEFVYGFLDPPALLKFADSSGILKSEPCSLMEQPQVLPELTEAEEAELLKSKPANESHCDGTPIDPLPPPGLAANSWDWIGLYPADFTSVENGYITYVYAPKKATNVRRISKAMTSLNSAEGKLFGAASVVVDTGDNEFFYRAQIDSRFLTPLRGKHVQLVYWSKKKNCAQGYSRPFLIQ